jgi:hypothetical protein
MLRNILCALGLGFPLIPGVLKLLHEYILCNKKLFVNMWMVSFSFHVWLNWLTTYHHSGVNPTRLLDLFSVAMLGSCDVWILSLKSVDKQKNLVRLSPRITTILSHVLRKSNKLWEPLLKTILLKSLISIKLRSHVMSEN